MRSRRAWSAIGLPQVALRRSACAYAAARSCRFTSGDELRGCLGRLDAEFAAWCHPRLSRRRRRRFRSAFSARSPDELPFLQMEISLLTPEHPIASIDEIIIGTHGVIVEQGAITRACCCLKWRPNTDGTATLSAATCVKAGLPEHAWKTAASILVFEARIFAEGAPAAAG